MKKALSVLLVFALCSLFFASFQVHPAQSATTQDTSAVSNVLISPATDSISAGAAETYTATASDNFGNSWDVTASTTWNISDGAGGFWSGNVYTSEVDGSWTVYGTYGSNVYAADLTVIPALVNIAKPQPRPSGFNG